MLNWWRRWNRKQELKFMLRDAGAQYALARAADDERRYRRLATLMYKLRGELESIQ